ncbi:MAG: hypothetical protein ABI193_23880, partial [Minicystis sp.]
GTTSTTGAVASAGATTGSGGAGGQSIWGLATGGGGCTCEVGALPALPTGGRLALIGLIALVAQRRRARRRLDPQEEVGS